MLLRLPSKPGFPNDLMITASYKSCTPTPFNYSGLLYFNTRKMGTFIQSEKTIPAFHSTNAAFHPYPKATPASRGERVCVSMCVYSLFAIPNPGDRFIL